MDPQVSQNISKAGVPDNHCPFGCERADLDEFGYCKHLVGFTNDAKVGGKVEKVVRIIDPKTNEDTGYRRVSGKQLDVVLDDDTLVNPQSVQVHEGASHIKKEWVSTRVYRQEEKKRKPKVACPECGKEFKNDSGLRLHARTHKKAKKTEQMAEASA